ncbi:MAG: SH3 domain-containing protein [Thiomargarita sp.]|nr:SH3 domain-containing protein [Thiomargarita sp.]
MTIHIHTIDERKHEEFLKEERHEFYNHNLIKPGDEVVFCAKCQCAFLFANWGAIFDGKHCGQTQTLEEFPQTNKKPLKFKRKSAPQHRPAQYRSTTARPPSHSRRFLRLPEKVLLFLFIFILVTGFLITLEKQEIVNIPFIEKIISSIENIISVKPVMIITGAGVKLRKNPRWKSKTVIEILQIGTIVRTLEEDSLDGEHWYQVTTPTYKTGWVPGKYTMSINYHKREKAYIKVAKKKLKEKKTNYGDLVDLSNFLNRVIPEVTQPKIAKKLKHLHSLTLQRLKSLKKSSHN